MKTADINIRDPYVLVQDGKYYLFGTRSQSCWGEMDGFDCYVSSDLENWQGPNEVFHRPEGFWATENYWAPEAYEHNGQNYLVTTLGGAHRKKSINLFKADKPLGPYHYVTQLTAADSEAIDATIFEKDGRSYLVYSHTLQDVPQGDMCAVALTDDWTKTVGEPVRLFSAAEAKWAKPVPFAEKEFGIKGDAYFADGPTVYQQPDGSLVMLWSSWGNAGYSVGQAISKSGDIFGDWQQLPDPVIETGGHGMLFTTLTGQKRYVLHSPNDFYQEHPKFLPVGEKNQQLIIK
ncbi:glycoside hydrolase family 43 protein [Levilactobacillus fujinensis]|uniref:Glycoside hydrolase family 43 protein n=1 Tax=Levilactobacillus fujinensis TaxID=2486024 RepID=A0ABW1TH69_9LACO|nr:glycoside hydrolase family 43 protein [Levilactobacillus fujinensis]